MKRNTRTILIYAAIFTVVILLVTLLISRNNQQKLTYGEVIERFKNVTLLELKLETGRTHQIRVHMKYINHPVCNDPVYSNNKNIDNYGQLLHAKEISFIHPTTKERMTFSCEPEDKFYEIMKIYEEK